MPRPRSKRNVQIQPKTSFFKPNGIPTRLLKITKLEIDELEALRLKHVKKLSQDECSKEMNISSSTFQRILATAHEKVSIALINGQAIQIMD